MTFKSVDDSDEHEINVTRLGPWRRLWWALTGRPRPLIVERCRLITIDVDGEQITMPVLAEQPMSDEGRVAFAAIVAAAKRKFEAEAGERCEHTVPDVRTGHNLVCTKQPHPDSPWHADGSGARWRQDQEDDR